VLRRCALNRIRRFVSHCGKGKKKGCVFAAFALRTEEGEQAEEENRAKKKVEGKRTNGRTRTEGKKGVEGERKRMEKNGQGRRIVR